MGFRVGWDRRLGFDVLGAFAVGELGAAPELALGFAGGAAAHGLAAEGTEWGAGLLGSGLGAGGVEAFGEAAVLFEVLGLAFDLAFEKVGSLIDGAEHGVSRELGLGSFDEVGEASEAGEDDLVFGLGSGQVGEDIVLQALAHGEAFAGVLVPEAESVLNEVALVVLGELVVQAGPGDVGEFHLHFPGGGGGTAAFGDVAHAAASGLDHLVVGAAGFVDEALAEDDGGVIDGLSDGVAAEMFVAAVREEEGLFPSFFVRLVRRVGLV